MIKSHQLTCKTGLRKGTICQEVFDREIALCQQLSKKRKGGCGWGECQKCGVIPLLYKLHKGRLLEKPAEIKKTRDRILQ